MTRSVTTRSQRVAILDSLVAADGLLDGAKVDLFKNDFVPNPNMVVGDMEAADFSGYAQKTVTTWGEAYHDSVTGDEKVVATSLQWNQTASTIQNTVYGYMVKTSAGVLVFAKRFDDPVEMTDADSSLPVAVELTYRS